MSEYKAIWVKIGKMKFAVDSWTINTDINGDQEIILKDIYFKNKEDVIVFAKKIFEII